MRKVKSLKLLSKIILSFQNSNDFDTQIELILKDIGEFTDVSRIYIFLNEHKNIYNNVFQWCNEGVTQELGKLKSFSCQDVKKWNDLFKKDGYIKIEDMNKLPNEILRKIEYIGIKSILAYPLTIENKTRGFIGFNEHKYERKWKDTELEILNTVSLLVANAYEKKFDKKEAELATWEWNATTSRPRVNEEWSDIKEANQIIRESEKRFFLALDKTKAGLWDMNLITGEVFLSRMWKQILGYEENELENSFETWKNLWHPEDKRMIQNFMKDYSQDKINNHEIIHRLKHRDGSWRWILSRGGVLRDKNNIPYRWIGTHTDITKEHEQSLELERIFLVNLDLLCIIDMNGRFIKLNRAWKDVLGYPLEKLIGHKILEFVHEDDLPNTLKVLNKLKTGKKINKFINRYQDTYGNWIHLEWRANPYEGRVYAAARDITDRIKYERKILEISNRDSLTNVYSRRYILDRAKEIIEEYKRVDRIFSICIIDIDHFKGINDSYGHQTGDKVLKKFTKIIKQNLRPYDVLGRYGGEEFMVILNNADRNQGGLVIKRILETLRNKTFIIDGDHIEFTFSAGIINCNELDKEKINLDKLIEIADKRMYQAKNSGRNKIIF